MQKTWTTSPERGAELLVSLRRAAGVPLRAQLEEAIRAAIRDGRLTPGERLPSSRTLATDLGVARGVVVEAYAQLTAEGWLTAEHGSGTRVSKRALAERTAVVPAVPPPTGARAPAGPSVTHGVAPGDPPVRWDFRPGLPDLAAFPRQAWVAATRRVLAGLPAPRLGYGDPAGTPELRAALAAYLGRVRGVLAAPDRVIVCTGFGQALGLVAGVLADHGLDRMAVEDPLNQDEPSILARAGLTPVPVPVDDLGLDVDALAATGVRAAMLTPAHQFPTGVVLAPRRRAALIDWARARDGLVVEDDYDAEYRYDRGPVGAVQGLDPERVAYAGSVSKTLAPALRLGWLVVPARMVADVAEAKRLADHGTSALDQLVLADLLGSGTYDHHLRRTRRRHRARRDLLAGTMARLAPRVTVRGVAAGLHVVVELPAGADEAAVTADALAEGIRVYPMRGYRTGSAAVQPPALVLGYGGLALSEVGAGAERLGAVLSRAGS
jgi:GntR family transcriptional regulator/MocR family aminotransferase